MNNKQSTIKGITIEKATVLYQGYEYKVINITGNKNLVIHALAPYVHPAMEIVNINQIKIVPQPYREAPLRNPKVDH